MTFSGVTTIAGGYSKGPGKMDGPAQSASFSEDFELIFISERCSLLISDRGNRLVREMILKHEDCAHSQLKLGSTWVWALGLGIACLLSLAMWLAAHRFLARDVFSPHCFSKTWKHCQIILGTQVVIIFSDIRSAVASSTPWAFLLRLAGLIQSHVCLIFKIHKVENQKICREPVYSLDLDVSCHHQLSKEQILADQLKDMISFDGEPDTSMVLKEDLQKGDEEHENSDVSTYDGGILDGMIQAAIMDFTRQESPSERSLSAGWIVKRR
uniref:Uncharacterized protein n=1 Tax=Nelumbo nucifera TaxID=4432 RepID=A0A822YP04_NELNU|nr:TPA_asm: hypothetical protein HUJ06_009849 [Nelumbo nucifera]